MRALCKRHFFCDKYIGNLSNQGRINTACAGHYKKKYSEHFIVPLSEMQTLFKQNCVKLCQSSIQFARY